MISFSGGFYSDDIGYVAKSCKKCPNGSFVHFDKTPGTRKQDCKSCPEGNGNKKPALLTTLRNNYRDKYIRPDNEIARATAESLNETFTFLNRRTFLWL